MHFLSYYYYCGLIRFLMNIRVLLYFYFYFRYVSIVFYYILIYSCLDFALHHSVLC